MGWSAPRSLRKFSSSDKRLARPTCHAAATARNHIVPQEFPARSAFSNRNQTTVNHGHTERNPQMTQIDTEGRVISSLNALCKSVKSVDRILSVFSMPPRSHVFEFL